ncbi:MAG: carbamoyltransferase [Bacteroidetes bacterium]|nr:carbamoyltransferase [Bacteroidota bacterium]
MNILGISAFYHDSAAALLADGKIIAAMQEERFTRKKNDASFPAHAIRGCLQFANLTLDDIDAIAFYDKPFLKFERLLETYQTFAPKGLISFLTSMPVWLKQKLFLKKIIINELKQIQDFDNSRIKLLFPEHHLSHAASAFYPSGFERAAIITIDGVGEWATASICKGDGNKISVIKELHFPHSIGLLYSAFTYYCGFKVNSGEYKLMGLAPYGNSNSDQYRKMVDIIKTNLIDMKSDGSVFLNQKYFDYATGLRMVNDHKWKLLFGFKRREENEPLTNDHCNLALAIQTILEEIVLNFAGEASRETGFENLCMAGGVALNAVANGKLHSSGIFRNIFIQPAAGDAGGALGAAYAAHYIFYEEQRKINEQNTDEMKGSFLGPEYSNNDVIKLVKKFKAKYSFYDNLDLVTQKTAGLIADGNIIGWFQGRAEFGPRALGARSILADPRNSDMQKKLNLSIKFREGFRPFAPSVLADDAHEYFDLDGPSPYMLLVKKIKSSLQYKIPEDYFNWTMDEKLNFKRSDLPAITHIDYSARIQTVNKETNYPFRQLLCAFKKLTSCPVLINTSFNVRGEPIVNTPEEAYLCFMHTNMDYLVIGNFIFDKMEQPLLQDNNKRKELESD